MTDPDTDGIRAISLVIAAFIVGAMGYWIGTHYPNEEARERVADETWKAAEDRAELIYITGVCEAVEKWKETDDGLLPYAAEIDLLRDGLSRYDHLNELTREWGASVCTAGIAPSGLAPSFGPDWWCWGTLDWETNEEICERKAARR